MAYTSSQIVQAVPTGINSALVLISSTTIGTTVSSVTVSSAFSATYDNYVVIVTGGTATNAFNYLTMQLGATTTGYYFGGYYSDYSSLNLVAVRQSNGSSWRVGVHNTSTPLTAFVELLQPNVATETRFNARFSDTGASGTGQAVSGFVSGSTQYTAFTISTTSGTMTGGTIRVYGYTNS
jgi:hypothetical protein